MQIIIIFILILFNGVLSMSEIALVSIRKAKLESDAEKGDKTAARILRLVANPDRFLSMIQIGITLVGILNGLFSAESLDEPLARWFVRLGASRSWALPLSQLIIVVIITYLTIVLGELVPKMIGMNKTEKVARIMVNPIRFLSSLARPLVWILSVSTKAIVRLLGVGTNEDKVTEEEIKAIVNEGYDDGEVKDLEREIVENAFDLDNVTVASVMTHRSDYDWLDIQSDRDTMLKQVKDTLRSVYPVCDHSSDNVVGVLFLKDFPLLDPDDKNFNATAQLHKPHMVPESMSLYKALESFRRQNVEYAIVVDEYGAVQGIVTLHDIIGVLVGDITVDEEEQLRVVHRDDNSLLVDGQLSFYEFLEELDIDMDTDDLPYQTVGGLVLDILEHIPQEGEKVKWRDFSLEVVDMDGPRIDKLLVTKEV